MPKSKDPIFLSYEQRVLHRQAHYAKLKSSPRSELRTLQAYKKGLLLQLSDINVSIEALERLVAHPRRAAAQGRASEA
jgi:hypothetical protein